MWLWIIVGIWAVGAVAVLGITIWDDWGLPYAPGLGEKVFIAALWPLLLLMAALDGF